MANEYSVGLGWLGVLLSIVFWGMWGSFNKMERVQKSHVSSTVVQARAPVRHFERLVGSACLPPALASFSSFSGSFSTIY